MTTAHISSRQQNLSPSGSVANSAVAQINWAAPDSLPILVSSLLRSKSNRKRSLSTRTVGESFAQFPKQSLRGSLLRKLAGSWENAKRFLRLGAAVNPPSSPTGRSTPRSDHSPSVSDIALPQGDAQMLSTAQVGDVGGMRPDASSATSVAPQPVPEPTTVPVSESTDSFPPLPNEKIVATGSGITVGIALTEPVLYLAGYDHSDPSTKKSAILRGQLHLKVTKSVKIKKISICFHGYAQTDWPDGNVFLDKRKFPSNIRFRNTAEKDSLP